MDELQDVIPEVCALWLPSTIACVYIHILVMRGRLLRLVRKLFEQDMFMEMLTQQQQVTLCSHTLSAALIILAVKVYAHEKACSR